MQLPGPKADRLAGDQICRARQGGRTMRRSGVVDGILIPAILRAAAAAGDQAGGRAFHCGGKGMCGQADAAANANDRSNQGMRARPGRALAPGKKRSRTWWTA